MPSQTEVRRLTLPITAAMLPARVDKLLAAHLGLSSSVIRRVKWLEDGILVDGTRVTTRYVPRAGQVLSVRVSDAAAHSGIVPALGTIDIVYEDADLLVINKAAGCAVHPAAGHYCDTLGNYLMNYYKNVGISADFHPVHRLDIGTSGLLVVAKHPHAQTLLTKDLHTNAFARTYRAVCHGVPPRASGVIDAPIGKKDGVLAQQEIRPDGKRACTHYRVLAAGYAHALLELTLETGRTHQIRVHLAHMGHPLVGDGMYGCCAQEISRPALHSYQISLRHPVTKNHLHFTQSLPPDMAQLVEDIRLENLPNK